VANEVNEANMANAPDVANKAFDAKANEVDEPMSGQGQ
jgi:hypothetical protein